MNESTLPIATRQAARAADRWETIAAAGGAAFVVLQLLAQGLIQAGGAEPPFDAPASEIVNFFANRNPQLFALGGLFNILSFIAFLWFLGALWAALRRRERAPGWLSLVAFGSGLLAVATILGNGAGWELAMHRFDEGLAPATAQLLFDQGNLGFANYWVALAGMLLAAGVAALRDGGLPRWLAWFGLVAAAALLAARPVWAAGSGLIFLPYLLFYVWTIAASVALLRQTRA